MLIKPVFFFFLLFLLFERECLFDVQYFAFRNYRQRHFKETRSDIDGIFTLLLPPIHMVIVIIADGECAYQRRNKLPFICRFHSWTRLSSSLFAALLTDIEAIKVSFHYIIATVMRHEYLVAHKGINSVCKYLSAAMRKESPSRGEDNGGTGGR